MDTKAIKKYIQDIKYLAEDVNKGEIYSHINRCNLPEWLNAWQNVMKQCIKNIEEEIEGE